MIAHLKGGPMDGYQHPIHMKEMVPAILDIMLTEKDHQVAVYPVTVATYYLDGPNLRGPASEHATYRYLPPTPDDEDPMEAP